MPQALEGVRIVDYTQGMAGALATMIFADYGADVIRLEPSGGDPWWSHPAYLLWNRGKRSVEIDWSGPEGSAPARRLISGADVFIETLGPGRAERLGIGYESIVDINPALVYVTISAFGEAGPYKDLPAYDGIVNAKSGRMRDQVGWQPMRPNYRAVNDTSYHTAMFTVQAVIAALRVSWMTGRGQRLDTNLLRGTTAPNNPWRRFVGEELPPDRYPAEFDHAAVLRGEMVPDRRETDPYTATPAALCVECKDGRWIMHSHAQLELFKVWLEVIGFGWIWDDPRFNGAPYSFPNDADRIELNLQICARMKEKTADEWIEIYRANPDCAGEIMRSTQEVLNHPQFVHNGSRIEIDDPRVGRIAQLGAFVTMSETPAEISQPAPFPGQHTDEILSEPPRRPTIAPTGGSPAHALDGIIMIELASWLASPFAGALLADLGARVIKVEPLSGDPFRIQPNNDNMVRVMQGKESIALNLKDPRGLEALYKLVARADVVMHNYRPGVPARLGVDYETLRAIKPDLVYLYASAFGSTGPDAMRAAFNPVIGALTGNSVFQSGEGNNPMGDQSPDPIAGSGVATGIMLGLAARLRTGKGQYLETTMMTSGVYCNSDDAFDFVGKPPRRNPDKAQLGLEATYRLYETMDGWIFLAAWSDCEFGNLCRALGLDELLDDARFETMTARYANRQDLGERLAAVFATATADGWEARLVKAEVPCVRADGMGYKRFLYEDPQPQAIEFLVPTQHSYFNDRGPGGTYYRHAPVVNFSETPCRVGLPFVQTGEHTRTVLLELHYSEAEIARLKEDGVVTWPEQLKAPS